MRFYNILYQKLRFAALLVFCLVFAGTAIAQEKKEKKVRQMVDVTIKVADESGTPIPKAQVVVGEGVIHTETDENGSLTFKAYPDDFVAISSAAYEKKVFLVVDLVSAGNVTLVKSKLYKTSSDVVQLPFTSIKKRNASGSTSVIDGKLLETYPTTDLRNSLTGLATGLEITEVTGQPGVNAQEALGSYGSIDKIYLTSRGYGMQFIIDNVPTDITEMPLDPNEIESVSVVKDIASKAMFGPAGANGIILITTKRGQKNEHSTNINFERGVSTVDRMPEFVSGADYARLNNQARINDGLTPNYTQADIDAYALNNPYDKFHPSVNFREMTLKNNMAFTRANVSSSGGNDLVQYSSYLGYNGEGDIYKVGEKSDYNKITTRSNIDIKINDFLKVQFDFYGNLSFRRSPNYGFASNFTSEDNSALQLYSIYDFMGDITSIPPIAFPVYASYDSISKVPWYGVSQAYGQNPIAGLEAQGYFSENGRSGASNIALEYDMGHLIKGLKSKTFFGFDVYDMVRIGKAEDYIAYIAQPSVGPVTGADTILLKKSHLGYDMADQAKLMDYYFQRFAVYENLAYDRTFGRSAVNASLTYFKSKVSRNGIEEPERQQNGIFTGTYTFDDKYSIMGVLNYAGTSSFSKEKRYAVFPSGGVSWVVSEESFLKGSNFINFLKLRAQAGILGVENFLSPFYYRDRWSTNTSGSSFGPPSSNAWFGTDTESNVPRSSIQRIGNPNLTWEQAREFSAGLDALFLKEKLSFELTYYNNVRDGQIVQIANDLPYLAGLSSARPWYNHNKTRYFGVETGLNFSDRHGDFAYSIGGSATLPGSERIIYDEPNYRNGYQSRVGQPVSAIYGYTYLGKFQSDDETLVVPQKFDFVLHQGDLKYADLNGDKIIDDNDMSMIGNSAPKIYYSLNARLAYKNFELYVLGTGRAFNDVVLQNKYFWNGWGDDNYSKFVLDNINGAYPRLTYYKVNNNFVTSQFWMRNGGFFKVQNVELAYNLPASVSKIVGGRLIRFYVRGANLLTISRIKDVDPENMSSGVYFYPLFRTFTGGVKFNF